ncbi:MAG: S41 family peptidase [Nitrospiraceae bacterium]|nr:MAG: S41 family peptidase [Nitrospiraceae bacterium]
MFRRKTTFVLLLITVMALTGFVLGGGSLLGKTDAGDNGHYATIKTFAETLSIVKQNYVEEVNEKELVYGAIKGMLNSLDPHSSFMPPEAFKEMQIDTKGEFSGLGIQIGIKDKMLTVIAPIDDTPAYKAGIKAGDKILKIDGELTRDITLQDAVTKLRGPKGTSVIITVLREGWEQPKDFVLVREVILLKSVKSRTLDDRIGYIKLTQFQQKTASDLGDALEKLKKDNINALVLDLRNNPGGLLNGAVEVTSKFLPEGKLVVFIKGRSGDKQEFHTVNDGHFDSPMVVLVNEGSASASEIVAGALQDWGRAVVLGMQTFGKGSVQTVIPLTDGSALRLTTARYYTPKGRSIQTTGITPDIVAKAEIKGNSQAHPVLREKDLKQHLKNDVSREKEKEMEKDIRPEEGGEPEMTETPAEISEAEDIQLQRALDLLKTWKIFRELPKAG